MSKIYKYFFILTFASIVLVSLAVLPLLDSRAHLIFCDVGQGDGILIYRGSTQILVDGGPDQKILKCLSEHVAFWDRSIELVILTNPDLDHYGGLIDVARRYNIGLFVSPGIIKHDQSFGELQKELAEHHVKNRVVTAGNVLSVGQLKLVADWPTKEYLAQNPDFYSGDLGTKVLGASSEKQLVNPWSLVFNFSYGEFDALLTGDIVPPATDSMSNLVTHPVEVLKVPHHGSKNGLTERMLEVTHPALVVISAGKKNRYGHPHKETLEMLERWNVRTLGTYKDGEIEVLTDGKAWQVYPSESNRFR